jgi:hypothetical protein
MEAANRIVRTLLIGTNVESFGVRHQIPFIEFRNSKGSDMYLSIQSGMLFHPRSQEHLSVEEQILLGMNCINLKKVVDAFCSESSDLEVHFADGSWFQVSGTSEDGYEPWQLSDGTSVNEAGTLLIALGEGYAIWEAMKRIL